MRTAHARRALLAVVLAATAVSACGGIRRDYEYEEELYLALDGTATLVVSASIPSLVALRGADLPVDPRARVDRADVRRFFEGPAAEVVAVSLSRRHGRRFVHATLAVADVRRLAEGPAFAWSTYGFGTTGDVMEYRQTAGASRGAPVADAGWLGHERVAFRFHLPSEIPFHTSPNPLQRGNILEWDQPLADRMAGRPVDIRIQMEPNSILYTTLLLFLGTIVAAAATFGVVIWFVVRRGRDAEPA